MREHGGVVEPQDATKRLFAHRLREAYYAFNARRDLGKPFKPPCSTYEPTSLEGMSPHSSHHDSCLFYSLPRMTYLIVDIVNSCTGHTNLTRNPPPSPLSPKQSLITIICLINILACAKNHATSNKHHPTMPYTLGKKERTKQNNTTQDEKQRKKNTHTQISSSTQTHPSRAQMKKHPLVKTLDV